MSKRLALVVLVLFVASLAVSEAAMQPDADHRMGFVLLFGGLAIGTVVVAWLLTKIVAVLPTLRASVLVVAVAAVVTAVVAVAIAASFMFLSSHDFELLLIVLGLALGLGTVVAAAVTRPLARDLERVGHTVARVADGDLEARTGVKRPDEVGAAAAAVDEMVERLAELEAERRDLLASIGHDLRTPLAAMRAAVEALEDGVAPDPDRYLASMHRDLDALSHLVDDLFLLSQLEAGRFEVPAAPVDLTELADEAVEALSPVAMSQNVEVRLAADHRVATVGASVELGRVIRNLLDNAIRYAPAASEVVVEVRNGEGALLRVVDAGPGFPPDFQPVAFDRFSRADPSRTRTSGGAGLGLAIARGVVEAHGGRIWVEAGPGGRVAFSLPAG